MAFDCRKLLPRCHAECCGPCPIPKATWEKYRDRTRGKIAIEVEDKDGFVHVVTTANRCPFVGEDYHCLIYPQPGEPDERAPICALFGCTDADITLICRWQDKDGRVRRRPEKKEVSRLISEEVKWRLKQLEKAGRVRRVTP